MVPLALQMGWVLSPPFFCAVVETAMLELFPTVTTRELRYLGLTLY